MQAAFDIQAPGDLFWVPTEQELFKGNSDNNNTLIGGTSYTKVYTDGSCCNGSMRELSRAGWGAYFGEDSDSNIQKPLSGLIPTSYRAELLALVHILKVAACHT